MLNSIVLKIDGSCENCGSSTHYEVKLTTVTDIKLKRETLNAIGYCVRCENTTSVEYMENEI